MRHTDVATHLPIPMHAVCVQEIEAIKKPHCVLLNTLRKGFDAYVRVSSELGREHNESNKLGGHLVATS